MKSKLHIIVTGEREVTRSYMLSKSSLMTGIFSSVALVVLLVVPFFGLKDTFRTGQLKASLERTRQELQTAQDLNQGKDVEFQSILDGLKVKSDEREKQLSNALIELKNRSEIVESILKTVGIKTSIKESTKHSGGPFTPLAEDSYNDLIFKLDYSLNIIKSVPLGTPVLGTITSLYGRRVDPINGKVAFHSGIDISKKIGAEIITTADGKVLEKGYAKGNGNYVVIGHGQDFKTRYFHMQKSLVEKGDQVKRGQVIGFVGNTGRSTGPHLHYEIIYNQKSVNPLKFVRVARNMPSVIK